VSTILVVDDERTITDFVSDALSEEGYTVTVCHDGASALLKIQTAPPDIVLLDIGLPVMTGDAVLRELRAGRFADLPVVVATASTNAEQYLGLGATGILKKPFTLDRLLQIVADLLEANKARPVVTPLATLAPGALGEKLSEQAA
jgi:DNA-binding response OmpR family regulator